MKKRKRKVTLTLPEEFLDLCESDLQKPEAVLRGFIADLAGIVNWQSNPRTDGYSSNGSDECDLAQAYYERVGYPTWAKQKREEQNRKSLPKSPGSQAADLNCRGRQKDLTPDKKRAIQPGWFLRLLLRLNTGLQVHKGPYQTLQPLLRWHLIFECYPFSTPIQEWGSIAKICLNF